MGQLQFNPDGWVASKTPPHGYRSAVAYDEKTKTWITVGPNGTDISTDDGKNWRALHPKPNEPADTDKNWNALSLPLRRRPQRSYWQATRRRIEAMTVRLLPSAPTAAPQYANDPSNSLNTSDLLRPMLQRVFYGTGI